jgi:hypothetical protein
MNSKDREVDSVENSKDRATLRCSESLMTVNLKTVITLDVPVLIVDIAVVKGDK